MRSLETRHSRMDCSSWIFWRINNRSINWELVTAGETEEEREGNAKYVISVARKLGCCVFLTWEDITEVKPKMIMTFVASVMHHALGGTGGGGASKN